MKKILFYFVAILVLVVPKTASAHCPLCVAGAGALAVLATSLGVSSVVVGILIGAFALALGLWLAPLVKKRYIPYQKQILTLLIAVTTIIPVMPFIKDYGPLYISLGGKYGTPWHNTYTIDLFLFGSVVGALLMLMAPSVSKLVTKVRKHQMPYQGVAITLLLLVIASGIAQIIQW
ncbi:MAG: hypothetical protein A2119_02980 [Candidatus Colwellbacteria bacterium GWA2_46_10]|uniref:Urease accessory protein UreH-like transmembrane domain-containing protein n=1 Tax=Candidatus Colwellbacteria bacterium GWA2_46_10 TaxID=1797684 RepID=A0A1G1YWC4_9BACT|nr:MAG: hypothetical protein UW86_C0010G0005 [Microgenomates group bacterium GW2011_GWA1_Microgenomates_45_10]KKU18746.1 MAG: hypothetical protein UX29_C0019G0005 [Parcubacteria group bacterium GW2011_GWA2_46_10]OGY56683.1 MAG: hypothetical protein A2119_02980 [Candidatus Colwellbacteria bacterium GWA2_46_10]